MQPGYHQQLFEVIAYSHLAQMICRRSKDTTTAEILLEQRLLSGETLPHFCNKLFIPNIPALHPTACNLFQIICCCTLRQAFKRLRNAAVTCRKFSRSREMLP
jgi:hypothetical protein